MSPPTTNLAGADGLRSAAAETIAGDETLVGPERARARNDESRLGRGAMLGRYIVLGTLGRGGMGIVYAAYDPELDRKVALKLLLPGRSGGVAGRIRLQREAQAIARLSHPNVVAVYDVGAVGEQVFIAMEFVDGTDLGRWMADGTRTEAEIVERFLQAGAGLAAAHAADLVHRDFKPENVLVGHDGRARVVDFGLVLKDATSSLSGSPSGLAADELPEEVSQRRTAMTDEVRLTDAGSLLGTPAYMSPEQFLGQSGDARSDQFSFCVSLYEALYGERPFAGQNVAELSYAVTHGEIRAPSAQRRVSGRLRRVLLRGLQPDPQARWPSMEALLVGLRKAVAPRRGPWVAGALLGLGGVAALWIVGAEERACAGVTDRAAVLWSPARKQALQQRFEQTALPFAADTWLRVQGHLERELEQWAELQQQVCESNHRQGLDAAVAAVDPRQLCLDERLDAVGTLLSVLDDADRRVVTKAVELAHGLDATEDCAELDVSLVPPRPSDPELRAQVTELRAELRRWDLRNTVGLEEHADETLQALVERAEALGYAPLQAEVWAQQSDAAAARGELDVAVELENRAFEAALASRHDVAAFEAANGLLFLHGVTRREAELGFDWARRAEALHQRIGGPAELQVAMLSAWASAHALAGDDEQAQMLYDEALTIVRTLDEVGLLASLLNNVGAFHAERRRLAESRRYLDEAARLNDDLLGPDHPSALRSRANLGILTVMDGAFAEGRDQLEDVLPRQESVLGLEHPEVANTLESLATALNRTGEPERAEALRRRVLAIREQVFGARSQPVVTAKNNLASSLLDGGAHAEARELMRGVVAELEAEGGQSRELVYALLNLSKAASHVGTPAETRAHAERALAVCGETNRCHDDLEISVRVVVARARFDSGERAGARAMLAEALERSPSGFSPWLRGRVRFELARTIVPDDPETARAMARQALEETTADDRTSQSQREEIEAWLREHA